MFHDREKMRCDDLLYLALASPLRITSIAEVAMTGVPKLGVSLRYRAFNTLIIIYEQNEGTEFEPLLETVVLILQIFGECSLYS